MGKSITATFRIVTPMFLGDWEHGVKDGIRPPSVKGALRFWWRTLNWKNALEKSGDNENYALKWLHKEEARLFGAAAGDNGGGQGVFLLSVSKNIDTSIRGNIGIAKGSHINRAGVEYLAGQGLFEPKTKTKAGGFTRDGIGIDKTFEIKLIFKNTNDVQTIFDALMLFGLMGNLGSSARSGFGSVALEKIEAAGIDNIKDSLEAPKDKDGYILLLKKILSGALPQVEPPYSAFYKSTRIDISQNGNDAMTMLDAIGKEIQMYRSYGRNGMVNGKRAEQNFKDDHDLMFDYANTGNIGSLPKRIVFGLPHNYFFSSIEPKPSIEIFPQLDIREESGRRASPLFIHIHKFSDGKCIAVQTILKAKFLHDDSTVRIEVKKGNKQPKKTLNNTQITFDYKILDDYLDRFKDRVEVIK